MKKFKILLLLVFSLSILTACDVGSVETEEIEVEFLEFKDNYAIYVSHERKEFYKMIFTKYEEKFKKEEAKKISKVTVEKAGTLFGEEERFYAKFEGEKKQLHIKWLD